MFGDMMGMMGKLKETQEKVKATKERLNSVFIEESSPEELLKVTITANRNIKSIEVDDALLADKEKLEDYLVITLNKAIEKAKNASIIIYIFDLFNESLGSIKNQINSKILKNKNVILIGNKSDLKINTSIINFFKKNDIRIISAKKPKDIRSLIDTVDLNINKHIIRGESSISINQRHYDSLSKVKNAMENVKKNLKGKCNTDLIALDIKYSLSYLGEITGEITNDDILSNIFSKFCIGK